jgi:PAS domain S-box-containing protein
MMKDDKVRQLFRELEPLEVPIGVYLVTRDGRFLECNRQAREILKLPLGDPLDASILDFYHDPSERERLIRKTEEAEAQGKCLERQLIAFKVEGHEVFVRDYCRSLRDPETNQVVGFIGCLVDVTEEENHRRLFELLPAGVYQVDADDRLGRVNEAIVKMFGYESRAEVEGQPVRKFYADPDEADVLRKLMHEQGSVVNRVQELVRKSGETFFASVSAFQITAPDGSYAGRGGIFVDTTAEERYRRSLNYVPVGFYEVRIEEEQGIISQCNEQFARMFDFDSMDEVIGTRISELYANKEDRPRFLAELLARDKEGQPSHGFELQVRSRQGREFIIELHSRLLRDRNGAIVGRVGMVLDITEEVQRREREGQLTERYNRLLSDFSFR